MTQRRKRSIAETLELFNLVFAIMPAIALILTTLFRTDLHVYIEIILIVIVILVNCFILWHRSKTGKNKSPTPFHTFLTNDLPPPQSGEEQTYNVEVAIIEDKEISRFRGELQSRFKTEFDLNELKSLLLKELKLKNPILKEQRLEQLVKQLEDPNLSFKALDFRSPLLEKTFKPFLDRNLEHATAVVVVRTDSVDVRPWVTEAVNSWAYKHSETPILFVQDPNKDFSQNETAKNFLWMPNDPQSLPWRLLERAKDRAEAWRDQATYNYEMVWNIFYILLMCSLIGVIWIHAKDKQLYTQKSEYDIAMKGMAVAVGTDKSYRQYTSMKDDATLSVSYWFIPDDKPCIFVTTENPHDTKCFEIGSDKIISCGFDHYPNHVIEWNINANEGDAKRKARVYDNYDNQITDSKCEMKLLPKAPIKAIVCVTSNDTKDPSINSKRTVGLCVFTENEGNNIFGEKVIKVDEKVTKETYRDFLRKRVNEFSGEYIENIESHKVTSIEDREKNAPNAP